MQGWDLTNHSEVHRYNQRKDGIPEVGAGGWQTTEKSIINRECLVLRHKHSLFRLIVGPVSF